MRYNKVILLLFLSASPLFSGEWVNPSSCSYSYAYAPGMNSSETQLAKYCPEFVASTGETVTCKAGVETIPSGTGKEKVGKVRACNFSEINLCPANPVASLMGRALPAVVGALAYIKLKHKINGPISRVLTTGALAATVAYALWKPVNFLVSWLSNKRFGVTIHNGSKASGSSVACHSSDLSAINVGQDRDIAIYQSMVAKFAQEKEEKCEQEQKHKGEHRMILYGVSRGSTVAFNTALDYWSSKESSKVAAVVCEGIFDSVPNISLHGNWIARVKNFAVGSGITQFKRDGRCPIKTLENLREKSDVDRNKPIALITSKADKEVPYQCTLNLYKGLKEQGFKNAHLLVLEGQPHTMYPMGPEKETYQNFIHAFYKRYNLPHVAKHAEQGQNTFEQSQPDLKRIDALLKK